MAATQTAIPQISDVPQNPSSSGSPTEIEYTKKARHGHAKDVVDDTGIRQVAGCLPIDPINKRFLLVSSRKNPGAWVIPKGGWEADETQEHAALRETWEEAGIKGEITRHIGVFAERNKRGIKAKHWIYELEIREVVKKFPEKKKRERRWFTYDEALLATRAAYLRDAIRLSSLNPEVHNQHVEQLQKNQALYSMQSTPIDSAAPTPERKQPMPSNGASAAPLTPSPPHSLEAHDDRSSKQKLEGPPSPPVYSNPPPQSPKKSFGTQLKSLFKK
ncbi:NUDIX hydrolase domain-like protein [Syncephalastrum racemosum]|uniref:NUDIX hydrolase domain-like protein n=1 Tax=Syncephalastrum racemosum TaxID=13706 RepID=A0A1X2HL04_SYNRA|nr:NUDIX hydrolase domain-like protein [Syncephalastrum racemosum]